MSNLAQLAEMNAQVVIPASTLLDFLKEDRAETWMEGVQVGMRMQAARQMTDLERPFTIKEAMEALGLSESSVRTLIANGELETIHYRNIDKIFIAQDEIRRFKARSKKLNNQ